MKTLLLAAAFTSFLTGCASNGVEQYHAEKPVLRLEQYLNGQLDGWGMFQGRSGEVKKRFHVLIDAKWTGDTGVLDESFTWSDGTTSKRIWTLKKQPDGRFIGTADDVDGKVYHVDFDDWMFLMDDKVMLNRSYMSKWGFRLGEVTLSFVKRQ
jgi:hypothetical protein